MLKYKLLTKWGEFVTEVLMPAWQTMPEIVIWGARHFVWDESKHEYREGCAYVAMDLNQAAAVFGVNVKSVSNYEKPKATNG
jgi:hypothetical protein